MEIEQAVEVLIDYDDDDDFGGDVDNKPTVPYCRLSNC